jgi:hypothetical protein
MSNEKIIKKYVAALDGRQAIFICKNHPKTCNQDGG